MRIIAGKDRGRILTSPKGEIARPTHDRIRESLFNIISRDIYASSFLDLFGGSGAITCEFISRGASSGHINELNRDNYNVIIKNLTALKYLDQVTCTRLDYRKCLEQLNENSFDFIYLDPPYELGYEIEAIKLIDRFNILKNNGIIIVETKGELQEDIPFDLIDRRQYGKIYLSFLKKETK